MLEANLSSKKKTISKTLLMHFDAPNGSTEFRDEGGRIINLVNNPKISTAQKKFGNSSALIANAGLNLNNSMPLLGDYTVECWVYLTAFPTTRAGIAKMKGVNIWTLAFMPSGHIGLWIPGVGSGSTWAQGGIVTNAWKHLAATRQGGVYRLFVDGITKFTSPVSPITPLSVDELFQYPLLAGETVSFQGHADEFRVIDGIAMYTGDFTPSTIPFTL